MCTIAILVGVADAPLILAANRDELYARDTRSPRVLAPGVAGGLDAQSGGTWLAVHRAGRVAAVTNQRALADPLAGVRSRGLAVRDLAMSDDPDTYVDALDPRQYASMNLVWGSAAGARVAYLRHDGDKHIHTLERGVHVLCNDVIGAAGFPRGDRLCAMIERALEISSAWDDLAPALASALGDHTHVADRDVPPSHLPIEIAREMTATCIHSPSYGTRSASLVALEHGGVRDYLHADGPPCVTTVRSHKELLA